MNRKCIAIILLLASSLIALPALAQNVEITPFAGYLFGGEFEDRFDDDNRQRIDVEESANFGLLLDFSLSPNAAIELLWVAQDTELRIDRAFGPSFVPLKIQYYHAGFRWMWASDVINPYVVGSIGATGFDLGGVSGTTTRFSWSGGGGVIFLPSEHFGVRFEGRVYSTFIEEDEDIYCDPYGCITYYDSTFLFQFDMKVGLVFRF